jgi:hypothetical protein
MIGVKFSPLRENTVYEYAARFIFGGLCTVAAGLLAKRFGPGVGGLFLAFPAIFPAGLTLIASHEKKRKARIGVDGSTRGRFAATIDSKGTAFGCIGLLAFAFILSVGLPNHKVYAVICGATAAWMVVSFALWKLHKRRLFHPGTWTRPRPFVQ